MAAEIIVISFLIILILFTSILIIIWNKQTIKIEEVLTGKDYKVPILTGHEYEIRPIFCIGDENNAKIDFCDIKGKDYRWRLFFFRDKNKTNYVLAKEHASLVLNPDDIVIIMLNGNYYIRKIVSIKSENTKCGRNNQFVFKTLNGDIEIKINPVISFKVKYIQSEWYL